MKIRFPGGVAVEATAGEHVVRTDQPTKYGGGDTAAAPFELFLASIGTCAGYYALRFCQQRGIGTADLGMTLETVRDQAGKRVERIRIAVDLPSGFPDKYRTALTRAIDLCAVKRHILEPPEIAVELGDGPRRPRVSAAQGRGAGAGE